MNIIRDQNQRALLESEYKGQLDYHSKIVTARQEGEKKNRMEVLELIARGYTAEDIKREFEARD